MLIDWLWISRTPFKAKRMLYYCFIYSQSTSDFVIGLLSDNIRFINIGRVRVEIDKVVFSKKITYKKQRV